LVRKYQGAFLEKNKRKKPRGYQKVKEITKTI
jgi:hypothetical protein